MAEESWNWKRFFTTAGAVVMTIVIMTGTFMLIGKSDSSVNTQVSDCEDLNPELMPNEGL